MYFHLENVGKLCKDYEYLWITTVHLNSKIEPKWKTRCKNTLRRWEKDHIEAKNINFHMTYLGNLY